MMFRRTSPVILVAALATFLCAIPVPAAGETYGSLSADWTGQVQKWLVHAAMKSPKWHNQRATIERHIEGIGYLLQNASLAIRTADYAIAAINTRHAIKMLELGIGRGFYRRGDVEPLMHIIAQQMPA